MHLKNSILFNKTESMYMYIMFYFKRYKCIYVDTQDASTCTGNCISQYI